MDILRFVLRLNRQLAHLPRMRSAICRQPCSCQMKHRVQVQARSIHTTPACRDMGEFFDSMEQANSDTIYVGRPWRLDELRIKSNEDLHKLWYILLKERNQLMSMDDWYSNQDLHIPSPERMEKVEESMENLLEVIRERDEAYNFLENGHSGIAEPYVIRNAVGLPYLRTPTEHRVQMHKNNHFKRMHPDYRPWMKKYLALYEEKTRISKHGFEKRQNHLRKELKEEFPHLTDEDLDVLRPWEKDIE